MLTSMEEYIPASKATVFCRSNVDSSDRVSPYNCLHRSRALFWAL